MLRPAKSCLLAGFVFAVVFASRPANSRCQSLDLLLNKADKASLDSAAFHVVQKIQESNSTGTKPKVLVVDFFRGSKGNSSLLGTLLADRFSESLSNFPNGVQLLDRNLFKDYLTREWTTLESLQSNEACLWIGREVGAIGVIVGSLHEENGFIALRVHFEGFGPPSKDEDIFSDRDENVRLTETERLRDMLFQQGHDYSRGPDQIPQEPGVLPAGVDGVGMPVCVYCPNAQYSAAARVAKVQKGTVVLSVVVTAEGKADSIYVVKGAPFGLTSQAIKAVQGWTFRPAQKDGKPVSVRVPIETTFRLF